MESGMHINAAAVIVAAIVTFFFGWLWYAPLFGKQWAAEMKITMGDKPPAGEMVRGMLLMAAGCLLTAWVFAWDGQVWRAMMPHSSNLQFGFTGGFFIWLGFFLPQDLSRLGWENKSLKLFSINTVYHFLSLQIVAMILAHWQ
jgi:hypothetical protein